MGEPAPAPCRNPVINGYSHDIMRLLRLYTSLGIQETFWAPVEDAVTEVHVKVTFEGFTIGIASADAAAADRGLRPDLGGRPVDIVPRTDDTDRDYTRLTAGVVPALRPPHDFLADLRAALAADPDGNPIQRVQHR